MNHTFKIALIDDEKILRVALADDLRDAGYTVSEFGDPVKALQEIKSEEYNLVLSDIKMPDMSGLELLGHIKAYNPELNVILMTAFGSIESAVDAMKNGAYDYITKPFELDELLILIKRVEELTELKQQTRQFSDQFQSRYNFDTLVGKSSSVEKIKEQVKLVCDSQTTVLITGETGTGKELLANIIHFNSPRRNRPLVKVSCAILARDVFESELFGHQKGAFTGAVKNRPGRFEQAHSGTIYLDDIDDIPLDLQVKLLRVLQEQEIERVGGNETIKIDIRVIASTKADLKELVRQGRFREDLYYRLNVYPIHLVPLRQRKEDIMDLIRCFEAGFCSACSLNISDEVRRLIEQYNWPGNVRELKNFVERMVLVSQCKTIQPVMLPPEMLEAESPISFLKDFHDMPLDEMMQRMEIDFIKRALAKCHGHQANAAKLLGIPASTLRTKLKKYGLTELP